MHFMIGLAIFVMLLAFFPRIMIGLILLSGLALAILLGGEQRQQPARSPAISQPAQH